VRQYVSDGMPDKKGNIRISGKDCRYMQQVLRLKRGDTLDVRLPDGQLILMQAVNFTKNYVELSKVASNVNKSTLKGSLTSIERGVSASILEKNSSSAVMGENCEYWLFQFMVRPQKMDQIIRQAVECGISCIVPIQGDFSSVFSSDRTTRWDRIVKEAMQQSGSAIATKILEPKTLKQAIDLWKENSEGLNQSADKKSIAFLLDEDPTIKTSLFSEFSEKPEKVALAVGCEGGMSKEEVSMLTSFGFNKIHFNTNILRAETAAIYGIAVLQYAVTEFKSWK
jgi:16S rRNA (uracil1498-N3)-methyltransferase